MGPPGVVKTGRLVPPDNVTGDRIALFSQDCCQALSRGLVLFRREEQDVGPFFRQPVEDPVEGEEQVVQVEGEAGGRSGKTVSLGEPVVTAAGADRPAETGQQALEDQPAMVIEAAHFTKV